MNELHPDRHMNNNKSEQNEKNAILASNVTRAYSTIMDPHARALHLLQLHGYDITEMDRGDVLVGSNMLHEIMEIREAIYEASTDEDLKPMLKHNSLYIQRTCLQLASALDDQEDYEEAKKLTAQLQYWNRIDETIREKMTSVS